MLLDEKYFSEEAKKHMLHQIRRDYVRMIENSLEDLDKVVKEYWQISLEEKLVVLSYLSCVKYRFSFWDFMIDEMKAQVFVDSPYNKDSEYISKELEQKYEEGDDRSNRIEGPIASIYADRSLLNLNYFLNKGANPLEARLWGTVAFDIEGDGYHWSIDSVYLDCIYDQVERKELPELFEKELFKYNLTQEQNIFLLYVEENFYNSFSNNFKTFFKQYKIEDLERLSLEYSQIIDYERIFLAEFIQWNPLFCFYYADNIFELAIGKLYFKSNYTLTCLHLLRRVDQVRLIDLIQVNFVNNKYTRLEMDELNLFYLELHFLVDQAKANSTNSYLLQSLEFYNDFVEKEGSGIKFEIK